MTQWSTKAAEGWIKFKFKRIHMHMMTNSCAYVMTQWSTEQPAERVGSSSTKPFPEM